MTGRHSQKPCIPRMLQQHGRPEVHGWKCRHLCNLKAWSNRPVTEPEARVLSAIPGSAMNMLHNLRQTTSPLKFPYHVSLHCPLSLEDPGTETGTQMCMYSTYHSWALEPEVIP